MKYVSKHRSVIVAPLTGIVMILSLSLNTAQGSVPAGPPTFSQPTIFTNLYQPFEPGALKVFRGHSGRSKTVVVDDYLTETRTFTLDGNEVECVILAEKEFEDGELAEISHNYFAQADDGTVYYFGEVVDIYEDGVVTSHEGSWLVGGPDANEGDPVETATASQPAVFMPANPEKGDVFKPEDLFPIVDETNKVKKVGVKIRVPGGRFADAIRIRESTQLSNETERKWYAPGVGVVQVKARGETLVLIASTLNE